MKLIDKKVFKYGIPILLLVIFFFQYSPLSMTILIGNLMNDKLFLDKNTSINLPKNWLCSLSNQEHSEVGIINQNFILENKIDISDSFFLYFEKANNKGKIEFPNMKLQKAFFDQKKYTLHDGKNCRYQIYQTDNQIDYIYISDKNALLTFGKYNKDIPKFIDEFCDN